MGLILRPSPFLAPRITLPRYERASLTYPSVIVVSALTATPGFGQVTLSWSVSDPNGYLAAVEVWMAKTNDRTQASHFGDVAVGASTFTHIASPQGGTNYYWIRPRDKSGDYGDWQPSSPTGGAAATPNNIPNLPGVNFNLVNGKIAASVAANALTIAIKTLAGADPSPSDPVFLPVRDAAGSYSVLAITAALSLTISVGSKLGSQDTVPFRLWLLGLNDSGIVRLGIIKCFSISGFQIYPISENQSISATAEGGAGAADSAGVVYAASTLTGKPFRILGSLEWNSGLATAGNWSAGPDVVRLQGPGMPKPGDVIQQSTFGSSSYELSSTATIPLDNTIPQSNEGAPTGFWDQTITPTSVINYLELRAELVVSHHTGSCHIIGAIFRDSNTNATMADAVKINAADDIAKLILILPTFGLDLNQRTYSIRVGGSAAGTWTINGVNGGVFFGGTSMYSVSSLKELMV